MVATVSLPNHGPAMEALGCRITVRVQSEATGGAFSSIDFEAPAGFEAPPLRHRHSNLDWQGYVASGTIAMELDERTVTIPAGGMVAVPRGVIFRWWNASKEVPVRWICTYTPGGFEGYFAELVAQLRTLGRPPKGEDLGTLVPPLWKRYGIEVVTS